MASPQKIAAARRTPDRTARVRALAEAMREREVAEGACTVNHLRAAGFPEAEIFGLADDARALLSGRPALGASAPSPARVEGLKLAAKARRIRLRHEREGRRPAERARA